MTTLLQTMRSDPLRASETLPILTAWLLSSGMDHAVAHVRIHPVWTNVCFLLRNRLKIKTLDEHWEDLCSVLGTHPNLRELDLSGSVLSKEAMKTLCVKLRQPACKIQNLMWGFPDPVPPPSCGCVAALLSYLLIFRTYLQGIRAVEGAGTKFPKVQVGNV